LAVLLVALSGWGCGGDADEGTGATEDAGRPDAGSPPDATADDVGGAQDAGGVDAGAQSSGPRGFVLIHCDPQEILNLHDNLQVPRHDWDKDGKALPRDLWLGLMDLLDLADKYGHRLTLQLSPPYLTYIHEGGCDQVLGEGRTYPADGGATHKTCRALIMAWKENGHELSVHHHGPNHAVDKFDGYTNRQVYALRGKRDCLGSREAGCTCENRRCYWCGPRTSPDLCAPQRNPDEPVGWDPEWRGAINQGPDSMWKLVQTVLGAGQVQSICMNHGDEESDWPTDPALIYSTNGGGYVNQGPPRCVGYDPNELFHDSTLYAWFYSHEPVSSRRHLMLVHQAAQGAAKGDVLGMVFHNNEFVANHLAEGTDNYLLYQDLFAALADPNGDGDRSDAVEIVTLTRAHQLAGKTAAPDPCVEACFAQNPDNPSVSDYTARLPVPEGCE